MARLPTPDNITRLLRSKHYFVLGDVEIRLLSLAAPARRCCFIIRRPKTLSAAQRNRWKRIAREVVRRNLPQLPQGYEMAVILRTKPSLPLTYRAWEKLILSAISLSVQKFVL